MLIVSLAGNTETFVNPALEAIFCIVDRDIEVPIAWDGAMVLLTGRQWRTDTDRQNCVCGLSFLASSVAPLTRSVKLSGFVNSNTRTQPSGARRLLAVSSTVVGLFMSWRATQTITMSTPPGLMSAS